MFSVLFGADGIVFMPANVAEASPRATNKAEVKPATGAPVEIRSLDLREGAPEIFVDLDASAPLVWTSFRNADGRVIIELPNAVPGSRVVDLSPEEGLVSSLAVQKSEDGSRPLTRLVIATRQEVEHAVTADGNKLRIQLLPVDAQAKGKLAFEPLHEEPAAGGGSPAGPKATAPAAPATAAPSAPLAAAGTPDQPMTGPAPAGSAATQLQAVEVLASTGGAVIRIAGDGEFPYSTFLLQEPERFVIDLQGVVNNSPRSSMSVDGGVVERVRVAQFKPLPNPVARVVFDLSSETVPVVERTPEALVVSFPISGGANGATAATAAVTTPTTRTTAANRPAAATTAPAPTPRPAPARQAPVVEVTELDSPAPTPAPATPAPTPVPVSRTAAIAPAGAPSPMASAAPNSPTTRPGGSVTIQPSGNIGGMINAKTGAPTSMTTAGNGVPGTETFAAQTVGQGEKVYTGEPIDLRVTNADVTDVLRTFAQISNLNIVVQPGVAGTVTAELVNVPWDQALEQVLKINNLGYELEGNVMRIAPTNILRQEAQERQQLDAAKALAVPLQTIYRRLSYADAGQVAGLLSDGKSGLLSQRGSVVVDARTNALIIQELPAFIDTVISVIELLDTPEPQVMIEARIIETTKRFTRDLGIEWGFTGISSAATGNTTGLIFPNNGTVTGGVSVPGGGNNGSIALRLGNVLNTFQLDVALQAAESEGLIHILSAPKVATLNNQQASIQSGLQIPIQTIANNTVTVQYVNATLRLNVTPKVTAEGTVMMDIEISKREPQLAFLVPGATNAPIATKDATTRLVVRDGGTAVIGGIYKVSADQGEDRVPGLANIPLIGNLFKNKSRREENEELLIFITPRVIKI
jgi:type IV pilus assembly protein PilQ